MSIRQCADSGHHLGAVDQGQALGRFEPDRRQTASFENSGTRHPFTLEKGLALAEQNQGQVGQGCQVSAGSHRPFLWYHWTDAAVEQVE